jgi:hypothetical protein
VNLALRKEEKLRGFEYTFLRKLLGLKRDEVMGG